MNESTIMGACTTYTTQLGTKDKHPEMDPPQSFTHCRNFSRGRTGQKCPGWKQRIASMQDATTPFTGSNVKILSCSPFDVYARWDLIGSGQRNVESAHGFLQYLGIYVDPSDVSETFANATAQRKLLNKIMLNRSAFQGGPFVAEIRSTIRGILHPLQGLRHGLDLYYSRAKKLKKNVGRAAYARHLSDTWLEFQFGWLPLVNDIQGGLTQLRRISKPRAIHFSAHGTETLPNIDGPSASPAWNLSSLLISRTAITTTCVVSYYGAYKVDPPYNWAWKDWGLETADFLPSVWEAIPYSFAVDYFTNIGQIISAYSYLSGNIAWVAKTVRKERLYQSYGTRFQPATFGSVKANVVMTNGLGLLTVALSKVSRASVSVQQCIPQLTFRVPGADSLRWLNLAALTHLKTL